LRTKIFRMGKTKKQMLNFMRKLAKKEGNNPLSPQELVKRGCPVSYKYLSQLLSAMARNGLLEKTGWGKYKLAKFRSTTKKEESTIVKPMKTSLDEWKCKVEGRMTRVSEELEKLQTDIDRCTEAILKAQKMKTELEAKKAEVDAEMAKLKKILDLIHRCPDFSEVIQYLKELFE